MPAAVGGEWSLLRFERERLTLMMSAARRDRIFYAATGPRVAVAPDLFRLAQLPWVGTRLDEAGLLFGLGRTGLRGAIGEQTMLERVRQLEPGSSVTLSAASASIARSEPFTPQARWRGSFEEALAETDALLRTMMREKLARTKAPAVMLSGGLDSSALACFAAQERNEGQPLLLLNSVAPPGSGLADEAAVADAVAARLGLEAEHVWPPADANIYRPPEYILAGASGPPLSTRHCLTETFQRVGRALGATILLDGTWGELTLSGYRPQRGLGSSLRAAAGWVRRALAGLSAPIGPADAFHVRLSPARAASLPERVRLELERGSDARFEPGECLAYHPGAVKALRHSNEFYGGAIRAEFPYRDLRLLRLFAGFPSDFLSHCAIDRAPMRHLLRGRLPDWVRLRTVGGPASPDHLRRMRDQADAARLRIGEFRKAEIDEWLDLDWLDQSLLRISSRGPSDYRDSNQVQLTAITAEFLTWWRSRS
jgi:asparagine synthase (glutamine-hydrolysing)